MVDIAVRISEIADRRTFFEYAFRALARNQVSGDYVEFGSCGALTFGLAYQAARRVDYRPHQWSFDSFQGLPEIEPGEKPGWKKGAMAMDRQTFVAVCDNQSMNRDDYTLVEGFYADTLSEATVAKAGYPGDICLAYVDCDLYASTVLVLRFLEPRLKNGMILAFDDYYLSWLAGIAGERKAFIELAERVPQFNFLPYLQYGWHGMSFVVEDRALIGNRRVNGHL